MFLKSRAAYYGPFAPPISPVIARSNILRLRLRECLSPSLGIFFIRVCYRASVALHSRDLAARAAPPEQRPHARRVRHAAMRARAREARSMGDHL